MTDRFARYLGRFARQDRGSATVEFVILFPIFMTFFLASAELGVLTLRNVVLERSLDVAVRDLRLGVGGQPSHDRIKQRICDVAGIFPDCGAIQLQLERVSMETWIPAGLETPDCVDRTEEIEPVINFTPGAPNDLMLIRACVVFDPFFPTAKLAMNMPVDVSGGYALVASSAFVVEPP